MIAHDYVNGIEGRARSIGLSIAELCRRADVANSTFVRWKTGDTKPNMETLEKLERVLVEAETLPSPADGHGAGEINGGG